MVETEIELWGVMQLPPLLIGKINLKDKDDEEPVENVGEPHEVADM